MNVPDGITREDVLEALRDLDAGLDHGAGQSRLYDVLFEGRRYPPKAVVGLAARRVMGRAVAHNEFPAGKGTKCFRVLESLGFEIVEKEAPVDGLDPKVEADAAAAMALLENCPDEETRRGVAEMLADDIRMAHEISPAAWLTTITVAQTQLRLNVGQVFVVTLRAGSLSVLLDESVLDLADARLAGLRGATERDGEFRSMPGATLRIGPPEVVMALWPILAKAHRAAVRRAAKKWKRSAFAHHHRQGLVRAIAGVIDSPLPAPTHTNFASFDSDDLLRLIRLRYPGWTGFRDERFHAEEVEYKRNASVMVRELLSRAGMESLLANGDTNELLARIRKCAQATNLLFLGVPSAGDLSILSVEGLPEREFCEELLKLFHGNGDGADRLGAYLSWAEARQLPCKWTFPTYFLFLLHPDAELFVKPTVVDGFLKLLDPEDRLASKPTAEEYERVRAVARALRDEWADLAPEDLVDVQGAMWVCATTGFWKIAPGNDGWQWPEARDGEFIGLGWEELGDLSGLRQEEFNKRVADGCAEHSDWTREGTDQVWTFLTKIRPGDVVVANRGTREVLGIGTVTGDYYYAAGERHAHRRKVRWEAGPVRPVSFGGWRRTLIKLTPADMKAIWSAVPGNGNRRAEVTEGAVKEVGPEWGRDASERRFWLFQANVNRYRLDEELIQLGVGARESWMVTRHRQEMKVGDEVALWQSGREAGIYGFAEIVGEPIEGKIRDWSHDPTETKVGWEVPIRIVSVLEKPVSKVDLLRHPVLSSLAVIRAPQGTNYIVSPEEWAGLKQLLEDRVPPANPVVSLDDVSRQTGFPVETLSRWVAAIHRKGQAVFYGPPGTGKTYVAERLAAHLVSGSDGLVELVQFHPAYSYEDFIQGLRPEAREDGGLDYRLTPGRFLEFCRKASSRTGRCVLIVDEVNRANVARVFGELMYLLEYRDREVPLASGGSLKVPANVRLLGTMNTADRSIALVDHALRRRFSFIALYPQYDVLVGHQQRMGFDAAPLVGVLRQVNKAIGDPHYEVGISFFMKDELRDHLEDVWRLEVEPYLEEYFFDQSAKVAEFRWEKVGKQIIP